jgi:ABC-2 type transport system permease protein
VTPRGAVRLLAVSWAFQLKQLSQSGFFLLTSVVQPLIFATIATYLFRAGGREGTLFYAALGAGLSGVLSTTLFGSGGAIQWQRRQGTLETLIVSPAPFVLVLAPLTLATSTMGVYSVAATLLWGRLLFDVPLELVHPLAFAVSLPVAVISIGLLGLVLASTFVLYRHANALSNLLEYPLWLLCGVLVPLGVLPGWAEVLGRLLSPTWGVEALQKAALGGDPWPALGLCVLLGALNVVIGILALRRFERLARDRATLSLV